MVNMINIKYVLFDLDGTVSDSSEGIIKSVQAALKAEGIHEEDKNLTGFIGPSLRHSFGLYTDDAAQCKKMLSDYRARYSTIGWKENKLYDGVKELLIALRAAGKVPVLASAKPEKFCVEILKYLGVYDYFDFVGGADFEGKRDDKKILMGYVLDNIGNPDPDTVIMVGDRIFDIECAHFHNVKCIGVRYGFAPEGELEDAGADYIVDTVADLRVLLLN